MPDKIEDLMLEHFRGMRSDIAALGNHFDELIARLVHSGRFASPREVLRAALELLEDQERLRQIHLDELRNAIRQGMDSESVGSIDDVIARNRARRATAH